MVTERRRPTLPAFFLKDRKDTALKIKRFIGGSLESNGYVLYHRAGGDCMIIDPGYVPKVFIDFVEEQQLTVKGIIATHGHHDHVGAVPTLQDRFDCPVYMHPEDGARYRGATVPVTDGDVLMLEEEPLLIVHTPGHTRGSICVMAEKSRVCFTGDTLFDTDLGRTDLEGGSEVDMERTIREIIAGWPNDITIYPGHDNGCTMKKVRIWNTEYLAIAGGGKR